MNEFKKVCKEIEDYGNRAYEKGQLDVLDKIRAEIMLIEGMEDAIEIIDKYRNEVSE